MHFSRPWVQTTPKLPAQSYLCKISLFGKDDNGSSERTFIAICIFRNLDANLHFPGAPTLFVIVTKETPLGFAFIIIVHAHLQLGVGVIKLEVGRVEDDVEGRPDGQVGLNERRQWSKTGVAILRMSRNIRFEQLNLFQIVCQSIYCVCNTLC